jgi:V/A-type H+-transporting ATPase subunit K
MKKRIISMLVLVVFFAIPAAFAQSETASGAPPNAAIFKYIAAAVAVGLACLGGGIAVGQIGTASLAAMSENPDLSGKAIPFVGLGEGICLWGFVVALMILFS